MVYQSNLRLAERQSLVVQVSGGALTRTSSVASTIKSKSSIFEEIKGRHNFWSRARCPALFFCHVFGDAVVPVIRCDDLNSK